MSVNYSLMNNIDIISADSIPINIVKIISKNSIFSKTFTVITITSKVINNTNGIFKKFLLKLDWILTLNLDFLPSPVMMVNIPAITVINKIIFKLKVLEKKPSQ